MIQFPYPRLNQIFEALQASVLTQQELADRCKISTRTIRTDVSALNDILITYGAQITHQRHKGYQLDIFDAVRYEDLSKQNQQMRKSPRNAKERILHLSMCLLLQEQECKLDDLANQWFVSRTSLQADMAEVRDIFHQYGLEVESKAFQGLTLHGNEQAIRACIAHVLFNIEPTDPVFSNICDNFFPEINTPQLQDTILSILQKNNIHLTDEGLHHLQAYCGIALHRIKLDHIIYDIEFPEISAEAILAGKELAEALSQYVSERTLAKEVDYLCIQIAARRVIGANTSYLQPSSEPYQFIGYLLKFISDTYCYDLRQDRKLHQDLLSHVTTMMLRVKYQITLPNPLVDHIKRYYPMAYDMTAAAIAQWRGPYRIPDGELAYLVMHIGVGIERNYAAEVEHTPTAILVCNSGVSIVRLIESQLKKQLPQLSMMAVYSSQEYQRLPHIQADIVISTEKLEQKNKPVLFITSVPTPFQIDQINKHIQTYRTPPYILECFFDDRYFKHISEPISQQVLLKQLCDELEQDGIVPKEFHDSVVERENITPTMLGDMIAIPHSVGLMANETKVYTVFSEKGIKWSNNHKANLIFLFAIKQEDYEEAMGLYELFVTFMDSKAISSLTHCNNFEAFLHFAKRCWLSCKKEW
ncbi:BglG family transcription antiterminator [Vibrio sp. E150_018]